MASSCVRGRLDWILGKITERAVRHWHGLPRGVGSHHRQRGSNTVWMWHSGTWFSRHGGVGVIAGLDDLRGLSNLNDSILYGNKNASGKKPCTHAPFYSTGERSSADPAIGRGIPAAPGAPARASPHRTARCRRAPRPDTAARRQASPPWRERHPATLTCRGPTCAEQSAWPGKGQQERAGVEGPGPVSVSAAPCLALPRSSAARPALVPRHPPCSLRRGPARLGGSRGAQPAGLLRSTAHAAAVCALRRRRRRFSDCSWEAPGWLRATWWLPATVARGEAGGRLAPGTGFSSGRGTSA